MANIGKTIRRIKRPVPTPVRIAPPIEPAERPIKAPNWPVPVKEPAQQPQKGDTLWNQKYYN